MSEKENKMVRFPRPMGTTAMAAEYQKSQNLEDLQLHYQSLVDG